MELSLVGSETPSPLMKKVSLINRSTKRTQRLTNQHFFPFKTNGRKCDFECPVHGIMNSGKIEGAYFGRIRSIFLPKCYKMTFFLKINFSNFKRWIITCFIVALFILFYVSWKIDIILADRLKLRTSIYTRQQFPTQNNYILNGCLVYIMRKRLHSRLPAYL